MKIILNVLVVLFVLSGCARQGIVVLEEYPQTSMVLSDFKSLPNWEIENYNEALELFVQSCQTAKTKALYQELCEEASDVEDAKVFLQTNFLPYKIQAQKEGLLTGYYEPQLRASLTQSERYRYPIYETPRDLVEVDLSSIYPELAHYRLRGRIEGNKLIPYYDREATKKSDMNASVLCYADSKIDKFFLEIQGSGRVTLDSNETIFIGYDNQNGHRYRAIGRYLVAIGALRIEEVSLQSIRKWLDANPERVDEVLNYNPSVVFFKQREQKATGALGVVLHAKRSIAIDRRFIPLGGMLYMHADVAQEKMGRIVLAQDTGGAIKGAVRADLFLGYGDEAMQIAGELKAPLDLWLFVPRKRKEENI
jgi:membrane-bound lytic murein transglycosylase A